MDNMVMANQADTVISSSGQPWLMRPSKIMETSGGGGGQDKNRKISRAQGTAKENPAGEDNCSARGHDCNDQ